MAIFVRITGDLAPIETHVAELVVAATSPASRLAAIRDSLRYIIIPMLQPREILYVCGKYIYEFGGKYYSKTHRSSLHIETLGGRMICYRDGQLLALEVIPRFRLPGLRPGPLNDSQLCSWAHRGGQMHNFAPAALIATEVATFDIAEHQWTICDTMDDPKIPVLIGTPL